MKDQVVSTLQSDPWRWWKYNDVATAVALPTAYAAIHQVLLALERQSASIDGRKTDKSKYKYNEFRSLPKEAVRVGDAMKANRLLKTASWLCAYVRDHPGISANKTLVGTSTAMGSSIHRQEGLALIRLLVTHDFFIRDSQGRLSPSANSRQMDAFKAAVRTWYDTHRTPCTSGSYLVPNNPKSGSTGGSNDENA